MAISLYPGDKTSTSFCEFVVTDFKPALLEEIPEILRTIMLLTERVNRIEGS